MPVTPGQRGVSLLELLVGIVIGMLTVLVITQVFLESEQQRRSPAAGADAQINGILALDAIQRDVRQSGYGLGGGPWLGTCTTAESSGSAVGLAGLPLAPLVIHAGSGTAPSDSIEVLSSGKINAAMQLQLAQNHLGSDSALAIPSAVGFETGDWLIISTKTGSACDAFQAQAVSTSPPWEITTADSVRDYEQGSLLSNMGAAPTRRRWSIDDSGGFALQVADLATGAEAPQARNAYPGIVLLRALYAKDTDGDMAIDTYDNTAPASREEWSQVIGLRLSLVVRSSQWNKEPVTANAIEWDLGTASAIGASPCAGNANHNCLTLDLAHTVAEGSQEWQHYRYRIYESLIPLRNLLWNVAG